MKTLFCFIAAIAPLSGFTQVILNADFEQPLYHTGSLEGQNGWFVNGGGPRGDVAIGAGTGFSSGVHFTSSNTAQFGRPITLANPSSLPIRISADIRFSNAGKSSFFELHIPDGRGIFVWNTNEVDLRTGASTGTVTQAFAFETDRYYNLAYQMDFVANRTTVFVDGNAILSSHGTTSASNFRSLRVSHSAPFRLDSDPGKTAQVDNVIVQVVPEPASGLALAVGVATLRRRPLKHSKH